MKAAGRLRIRLPRGLRPARPRDIGVIGCGQFAFATIGYFLRSSGHDIKACFDVSAEARDTFARSMRVPRACASADEVLSDPDVRTVYIASNHASHAAYAAAAVQRGLAVYVEKPIAVSSEQLDVLQRSVRAGARIFAGYNRPFSAAICALRAQLKVDSAAGITLQCFVSGHRIPADHWYRLPEEGTRICGNVGHWLDLFVHVLMWRSLPDRLDIALAWASDEERDDNLAVTITSDRGDLFSVMLTSRCEPFEGINETINFQHADTICKIDDFRRMAVWQDFRLWQRRFWPKDAGHRLAILQPFRSDRQRDWREVVLSTLLMLHIADMIRGGIKRSDFSFRASSGRLSEEIKSR